jgi:hypothetical protein
MRVLAALVPLCFAGWVQAQTDPTDPVPVPKATTKILLELDIQTLTFRVVQPYGARPCQLCTQALEEKFGKGCELAPREGINLCSGLIDSTVQDLAQIMLIRSHKNPFCITIASTVVGGSDVATQLCLCGPTDPKPPSNVCPAPMWIQ